MSVKKLHRFTTQFTFNTKYPKLNHFKISASKNTGGSSWNKSRSNQKNTITKNSAPKNGTNGNTNNGISSLKSGSKNSNRGGQSGSKNSNRGGQSGSKNSNLGGQSGSKNSNRGGQSGTNAKTASAISRMIPSKFKLESLAVKSSTKKNIDHIGSKSTFSKGTSYKIQSGTGTSATTARTSSSVNDRFVFVERNILNDWFNEGKTSKITTKGDVIEDRTEIENAVNEHGSFAASIKQNVLGKENGRIWPDYHFLPGVMDAIKHGLKFTHPSPVQVSFLSCYQNKKNILCGSQTGSGKTAAYLIALFEELKRKELQLNSTSSVLSKTISSKVLETTAAPQLLNDLDSDIDKVLARITLDQESTPTIVKLDQDAKLDDSLDTSLQQIAPSIRKVKRPRAIILVPSRHLVHQVTSTAKEMSHYCRLRVVGLHSKTKHARESYQDQPIDILVSTPTTLLHLIEEEGFSFSQLQTLVLDEADTLFDKNFLPETSKVIQQVQSFSANRKNSMIPCYLFTATFPQTLNQTVSTLFPTETGQELVKLTTPSLHRPVKSVHHAFLRLNQSVTKPNLLVESIKKSRDLTKRLLVFCNTQDTASKVETFLKEEKKVPNVVLLSSHLPLDLLKKNLDSFLVQNDQFVIAISTDLASRGLDTLQVGHVINYDFPLTVMDYVHRSGRTGRYGRKGRCTSFLEKRDLKLASDIEEKIKRGTSL